jgi:uncharacterized damage-inducible protein DinB
MRQFRGHCGGTGNEAAGGIDVGSRLTMYSLEMDIRELLIDTTTHVPPARVIENISAQDAVQLFKGASHSIAEILAHMVFWQEWVHRRCQGVGTPIPEKAMDGWPTVQSDTWPMVQSRFIKGLEDFVRMMEGSDLDQKIVPALEVPALAHMTRRDAVIHVANHNAHHLGQIIILRQIMGLWPPPSGGLTW